MNDIDIYDYDFRTHSEKVYDDNTWRKERGILLVDGEPYLMYCEAENKVVNVILIEGSTVFDRYGYVVCANCGIDEKKLREPTDEELNKSNLKGCI